MVRDDLPPRQLNALEVHGAGQLELDSLSGLAGLLLDEPDLGRELLVRICIRHSVQVLGQCPLAGQLGTHKIIEIGSASCRDIMCVLVIGAMSGMTSC